MCYNTRLYKDHTMLLHDRLTSTWPWNLIHDKR